MTLKTIDKDLDGVTSCINLGTNPNYLYGCTNQYFYDLADSFYNYEDGDIV